jgi:hypothetical protein
LFNLGDDFTFPSNFSVEGIIDRATAYVDSVETKSGIGLENKKLKNKKFSSKLIRKIKINKGKQKKTHRKKVMDMDPNVASVVLTDVTPVLLEKSQALVKVKKSKKRLQKSLEVIRSELACCFETNKRRRTKLVDEDLSAHNLLMREFIFLNPKANPMLAERVRRNLKANRKLLKLERSQPVPDEKKIAQLIKDIENAENELDPFSILAKQASLGEVHETPAVQEYVVGQLSLVDGEISGGTTVVAQSHEPCPPVTTVARRHVTYSTYSKREPSER